MLLIRERNGKKKEKSVPQTIPAIATTEALLSASPALVATAAAAAAEIGFIVG